MRELQMNDDVAIPQDSSQRSKAFDTILREKKSTIYNSIPQASLTITQSLSIRSRKKIVKT